MSNDMAATVSDHRESIVPTPALEPGSVLSAAQLEHYRREGFCLVENCFSPEEITRLREPLDGIFSETSPRHIVEKGGKAVRSVFGSHATHDVFARLVRHPRLLTSAEAILAGRVYVHQFKINVKAAFAGDVWDWHQDYIFWREEDGMPTSRVTNVVVYLDDVTEFNGPLFLIPRSHRGDAIDVASREAEVADTIRHAYGEGPTWLSNLTADLRYALPHDLVGQLVQRHGLVSTKAPAGSVLFFDANLVHASANNVSPFSRVIALVTYNSVHNVPRGVANPRPDFLSNRDATPLSAVSDDALTSPRERGSVS
jgi:ectoine hydroxylase